MKTENYPFLLDGKWIDAGEPVVIRSPYDQAVVGETVGATREHLEQAIRASVKAFHQTRLATAYERQQVLLAVAEGIRKERETFAHTISLEAGKPIKISRAEVDRAIFTFTIAAAESLRVGGEYLPMDLQTGVKRERWGVVKRFPIGPIAAITPFNFPLNLVAHKLAPAIASGCPVVLKPAPQTPLSALLLARLIHDAGWPAGALNVLPLSNEDAAGLVEDDRLKMLSFTGSAKVGWELKSKAGKKRVVLELGGNAGVIVHGDADINDAASRCAVGGFSYAGQSCISVQRIYVQRSLFQNFVDALLPQVRALRSGDPLEESTDVGPLIRESDAKRVEEWIMEALSGGAKLLCGGKRNGSFVEPAVLTGTKPEQLVNCEEIFGPVVSVEPYDDFEEALRRVNHSRYGLQAGLFTHDSRLISRAFDELEVGGLIVNDVPTFRSDHMPYGGVKDSGMGREGVGYAMEEMTEMKLLVMNG